ncbi:MAG: MFS transporter [Pseudomonadales bacterium]
MTQTLVRVGTLLLAVAILLTGHGLQLTLLPIRAEYLGWTTQSIALTGSAYFLGFVVGCLVIPSIVAQVAHIRTFMVMAALATIALLGAGMFDDFAAWLVLRFGTGFAFAGLYMVIESWLSEAAPPDRRGTLLAVYSVISLLAMVAGQSFLALAEPHDLRLVMGAAFILGLAILPIGLTRMVAPHPIPRVRFSLRVLSQASRVAVVCALFGGLVTGALWSVGPLVGRAFGLDTGSIGLMMAFAIFGGAAAQLPVGRLSDHTDRRFVIAGMFTLGCLLSVLGWQFSAQSPAMLYAAMFFIGAASMPIYALCIATAADNSQLPLIHIASGILIMNSIGSIFGPILVAPLIGALGGEGFFLFAAVSMLLGAGWAFYRISVVERSRSHEQKFLAMPKTSIVAAELADAEFDASIIDPPPVHAAPPDDVGGSPDGEHPQQTR